MSVDVRAATAADARAIAEVHVTGWQEAYAHLVPAESLARLNVTQRTLRWTELIAAPTPDIWIARDGRAIVGWASSSSGHAADAPRDLELEGIYILASAYGGGAGQALLDAAVGTRPAYLWVAADNPRALSFYARNRFAPDGAEDMHSLAGTPVPAIRLVR
jgi:L-amino acid N-acyltransferase YncA